MQLLLTLCLTALSIAIMGTHQFVGSRHFDSKSKPAGANLLMASLILSFAILLFLLWSSAPPAWALLAGLAMEAFSLWLFFQAIAASRGGKLHFAFDVEHPVSLVTSGPYRFVRHPFYTSYLIFWGGLAIGTWSIWAILVWVAVFVFYVVAARGEEAKFAASPMAAEYAAYRARTGMFWPRPGI